jgi:hypothetical protein
MSVSEWDDFFMHKFPRTIPLPSAHGTSQGLSSEQKSGEEKPAKQPYPFKSIAG